MKTTVEQLPAIFGESWEAFVRDWYLTAPPAYEPATTITALSALHRLWPEKAETLTASPARGPGIIAPEIELGILLAACEPISSFPEVLHRLKSGERSAYSELALVSTLLNIGYTPSFAPPIDGHVLDAKCLIEDRHIFFEVVAPECSDANNFRAQEIKLLSNQIQNFPIAGRIEIEVFDAYSDADRQAVVDAVRSAAPSNWAWVDNKARVRRIIQGHRLLPLFNNSNGIQIYTGGQKEVQDASLNIVIQYESSDERAKRVFNEEYHQFSRNVPNVLVVNVCAVSGGIQEWPRHMSRLLQSTRNRRVGAIVFFDQGVLGPPERIRRRWRVLVNPHSHLAIPESLLTALESIDESAFYGLSTLERIIAPN